MQRFMLSFLLKTAEFACVMQASLPWVREHSGHVQEHGLWSAGRAMTLPSGRGHVSNEKVLGLPRAN